MARCETCGNDYDKAFQLTPGAGYRISVAPSRYAEAYRWNSEGRRPWPRETAAPSS